MGQKQQPRFSMKMQSTIQATHTIKRPNSALVQDSVRKSSLKCDLSISQRLTRRRFLYGIFSLPPLQEFFQLLERSGGRCAMNYFGWKGQECVSRKWARQPEKVSCKLSISKRTCSYDTHRFANHLFSHQSPRGKMKLSC